MTIDAHAHILPRDYPVRDGFPRMEAVSGESARDIFFGAFSYRARDVFFDAEKRIEALDGAGIDEEIVSPMPPLLNYTLDAALGEDLFSYVNEVVAGYVAAGGGRIHGFGIVPLQDPAVAARQLSQIADLGLSGVEIATHVNGVEIGDIRFREVFQEAERLGLATFVHTLPRADEPGVPAALRGSVGVGIEATRGASSLAFGGHAEHCALDRVLFSHAAGGLPSVLARVDYFWQNAPEETRSATRPSDVARRFYYDSMVFDPSGLRFVIDYLGADRIVLGTDFPAMARPARLVDLLEPLHLDDETHDLIASGNARRLLAGATVSL